MRKFSSFLFGAMMGGLVGSLVGILIAPSSGDKTRTDIQLRFDNIRAQILNAAKERRIELEGQLQNLRQS
ncbi:MAG: YtxH domain-containing protein [Anaerolineaceae bacterium]|nr:YtxH domain-containing protein [Anaerolineaceae bacterium]